MTCPHCESDNIVEKETEHLFWRELYVYCDDCERTLFYGWKPEEEECDT
jgi:hypothetical protein